MPCASQESLEPLKDPKVPAALPNIKEGAPNLLPLSALNNDLRVEFPLWNNSGPSEDAPEYVELFWNDVPIDRKAFINDPIPPSELFIDVPVSYLREGEHRLVYEVTTYNGGGGESLTFKVTIDKTAPALNSADKKPGFDPVVINDGVTADYLDDNEDILEAAIPAYTTPKPGDRITWYWDQSSSGTTVGGFKDLDWQDYDKPLKLSIPGQWIRDRGDGQRFMWYEVSDRAGNPPSGQSTVVELKVKAQPVPRYLPTPKVVQAGATGWPATGTLNPIDAAAGVTVILNPAAVIKPGEVPRVQWAVKDTLGAYLADPVTPGLREYPIPKDYIAAHMGKTIPVTYHFLDKDGKPQDSEIYRLTVSKYPIDRLHAPQIKEGSSRLSLAQIPETGANVTLRKWPFSAAGQRITITVVGTEDATGKTIEYPVLDKHEVTGAQADAGIVEGQALIDKNFLRKLKFGLQFTVRVFVSFDNGQTWPIPAAEQFPWLKPTLIA